MSVRPGERWGGDRRGVPGAARAPPGAATTIRPSSGRVAYCCWSVARATASPAAAARQGAAADSDSCFSPGIGPSRLGGGGRRQGRVRHPASPPPRHGTHLRVNEPPPPPPWNPSTVGGVVDALPPFRSLSRLSLAATAGGEQRPATAAAAAAVSEACPTAATPRRRPPQRRQRDWGCGGGGGGGGAPGSGARPRVVGRVPRPPHPQRKRNRRGTRPSGTAAVAGHHTPTRATPPRVCPWGQAADDTAWLRHGTRPRRAWCRRRRARRAAAPPRRAVRAR